MRLPQHHSRPTRLEELLREIDELRLTLDMDLSVAAAAVEADRADITADVLAHDRTELRAFAARADRHLEAARAADAAEEAAAPDVIPVPAQRANRRRRTMLSASQAVLAAAACAAVLAGVIPGADRQRDAPFSHPQLEASYAEFAHAAHAGNDPQRLMVLGAQINRSIEPLIATATSDPVMARRLLRMLQEEHRLLQQLNPAGAAKLLAQTRALVLRLTAALDEADLLPPPVRDTSSYSETAEFSEPSPAAAPPPDELPAATSPEPTDSPSAAPAPRDTPSADPSPTTEPQPVPSPTFPFPFGGVGVSDGH